MSQMFPDFNAKKFAKIQTGKAGNGYQFRNRIRQFVDHQDPVHSHGLSIQQTCVYYPNGLLTIFGGEIGNLQGNPEMG